MATQKWINHVAPAFYPVTVSMTTTFPPLNSLRNCSALWRKNDKDPPMWLKWNGFRLFVSFVEISLLWNIFWFLTSAKSVVWAHRTSLVGFLFSKFNYLKRSLPESWVFLVRQEFISQCLPGLVGMLFAHVAKTVSITGISGCVLSWILSL